MFSLHFLKIFRQGYYVYSSVKRFDYSALMTAVVMVVQVMLTLKYFRVMENPVLQSSTVLISGSFNVLMEAGGA